MLMVIPNEGKAKLLDWAIHDDGTGLENFHLKLFQSNTTVGDASTLADFTIATFTGYADVAITRASMGSPVITSNVAYRSKSVAPLFSCTAGGVQLVYGWILVSDATNTVVAGQNFNAPRAMSAGADLSIDPFKMGLKTLA